MRLQQDFLGCANRIRAEASKFDEAVAKVMEDWGDATGAEFQHQHLQVVSDTLRRLTIVLQEAGELAARCGKTLREEDY